MKKTITGRAAKHFKTEEKTATAFIKTNIRRKTLLWTYPNRFLKRRKLKQTTTSITLRKFRVKFRFSKKYFIVFSNEKNTKQTKKQQKCIGKYRNALLVHSADGNMHKVWLLLVRFGCKFCNIKALQTFLYRFQ